MIDKVGVFSSYGCFPKFKINISKTILKIFFLHGNVRTGWCSQCQKMRCRNQKCLKCGNDLDQIHLLYPIEKKDYYNPIPETENLKELQEAILKIAEFEK